MILNAPRTPLLKAEIPLPKPQSGQVLIRVQACAVCRTDLHILDGELKEPKLPLVLGHEIVGRVVETGLQVDSLRVGDRVGVPWLGWACGECSYCLSGRENLCAKARFTGYQIDGGYAEFVSADARFVFPLPETYSDVQAAPLLCAGLIGYRCLKAAGDGEKVGFYGFGAAAHIIAQVAKAQGRRIFAFTRPSDEASQKFARDLGAVWAGDSDARPPEELDAAILFAPVGALVPKALHAVARGGRVVCGGIHMSDIPSFPYDLLWGERELKSVANLTREDAREFLALASKIPIQTHVKEYPLSAANEALEDLHRGKLEGAAVLVPEEASR